MGLMDKFLRHERPQPEFDESGEVVDTGRVRLLASAALVSQDQVHSVVSRRPQWQPEAWERYDDVPELKSGTDWLAGACSRVRLYAGEVDPDGSTEPRPISSDEEGSEPLLQPLEELFSSAGQAELLRRWTTHLEIPGESFLAGFTDPHKKQRRWTVASGDELRTGLDGRPEVQLPDTAEWVPLNLGSRYDKGDPSALVRLWQPHARRAIDPDSPIIALRGVLKQILSLSAHINASADSRLAGAGIVGIPDELSAAGAGTSEGANPLSSSPLVRALMESMIAPLKDRGLASAVAPLVLTGPAEAIAAMKHITFSTPFDQRVGELLENAIRRLATGLSIPAEILLGLGNGTYWNSFLIKDEAIQVAVAPRIELLCEALTAHFYRPMLEQLGVKHPEKYGIGYDISALSQRPDRSAEGEKAHQAGLLSDEAYVRILGFDPDDMPKDAEKQRRLMEKVALTNAQLAPQLLQKLGIDIDLPQPQPQPQEESVEAVLERVEGEDEDGETPALPAGERRPSDGAREDPQQDPAKAKPVRPAKPRNRLAAAAEPPADEAPEDDHARAESDEGSETDCLPHPEVHDDDTPDGELVGELVDEDDQDESGEAEGVSTVAAAALAACDDEWQMRCMEFGVLRALERSGQWLLNSYGRSYRGALQDVPLSQIHTHLRAQDNWHDTMLAGAHRELHALVPDHEWMIKTVDRYVRALLSEGVPHDREYLLMALEQTAHAA